MYFLLWTGWRAIEQENIHLSECDGSEILHYPSMHNEGVVEVLQPAGMSEDCGNLSQQDCWLAAIRGTDAALPQKGPVENQRVHAVGGL